jgi:hypothetical protein
MQFKINPSYLILNHTHTPEKKAIYLLLLYF